ncbi:basic salivary proline-rich protein 1-like [Dermacentor silvarum]|uniref:basic salivary proline-rich protein 1-like n=1 Tax=Dermacentor silvarum TaxID=543639 RepID=UPI002100857E|nr:basic salivary proline-rich protein 1-like [Dermacentor silvarum]
MRAISLLSQQQDYLVSATSGFPLAAFPSPAASELQECHGFPSDPILWVQAANALRARHAWPDNTIWLVAAGRLRGAAKAWENYEGIKQWSWPEWSAALIAAFGQLPSACGEPDQKSSAHGAPASHCFDAAACVPSNASTECSGGGSRPQPPPHRSQASRLNSSTSLSSAIHGGPGGEAYKTADEAADEMTRQPVYETTLGTRVKQLEPDQGPDRPVQSSAITLLGPQQHPRAGPLHPVPPSPSPPGVSATPGHKGGTTRQPPPQDARRPKRPPHQGSSRSAPVSSSTQQQPVPTPHGSSSSGGGTRSAPTPATRDHDPVFRQASAAIDQRHPPPWSPTSGNAPARAVAVKRIIHAGVKALPLGSARRPRHSGHRNEAPPQNGSDHALQPPRAPPPANSFPSYPCGSPRKPEEKRGRPAAPPTKMNGAPSKGMSPTPPENDNAQRQDNRRQDPRPERNTRIHNRQSYLQQRGRV